MWLYVFSDEYFWSDPCFAAVPACGVEVVEVAFGYGFFYSGKRCIDMVERKS